ncbi:RNA-directed DNA polymerase from mobile element jockey [Exaiptasia diaphana]|nr:RNA-directed DNA polymerase from mobile element jockey [Exaiptasia diaphana]
MSRDKRPSKVNSVGRFLLEIPWSSLLEAHPSCESKLTILTDIINFGLDTIMPVRSIKIHESDRPWISTQFKQLVKRRQQAFASGNTPLFKILRNKVNRERKRCRKLYYENKVKDLQNSKPRDWWREVKQLCGNSKSSVRDLLSILHSDLVSDEATLANNINQAFTSVMSDYSPLTEHVHVNMADDMPIDVCELSVLRKLRQISPTCAGGPDELPNWVLREYAEILSAPIASILNASFSESMVPKVWKIANVVPLPKTATVVDINKDLRPISLTSTLSKIAEDFIIEKALKPVVLPAIDPAQFGFIPGSCTTFALISMFHHWLHATDGTGSTLKHSDL